MTMVLVLHCKDSSSSHSKHCYSQEKSWVWECRWADVITHSLVCSVSFGVEIHTR